MKFKKNKTNMDIKLRDIHPNIKNPRKNTYEQTELEKLKENIKANGLINNIKIDEEGNILAGHRRYAVIKELGWNKVKCDIFVGLTPFQKSAILISDNVTQNKFDVWEHRKAIVDIYFNEFCEEYNFKSMKDRGYKEFGNMIGISQSTVAKMIKSLSKENITMAERLQSVGLGITEYDLIVNSPNKFKNELFNKTIEIAKKAKGKVNGTEIREKLRAYKRQLTLEDKKEEVHPNFYYKLYKLIENFGLYLTEETVKHANQEQKKRMYDLINKHIIPIYEKLENYKKDKWKKSLFE